MAEKVTVTENDNLYNKIAGFVNNIIPGEALDLPISTTTTRQPIKYNIRDNDGNIVETLDELPEQYKEGRKIYRTEDGSWTYTPQSKVSLDEATGKITVSAPDFVLERDGFKEQFGSQLETLSRYYQQSPTAEIAQPDGSSKTIPQIINELNDPNSSSSLAKYTEAVLAMQDQELGYTDSEGGSYEGDRKRFNIPDEIKLDDTYFQLRNAIAVGDDVNENTLQAVPKQLAQADFLRALESYDEDTGTVKRGDLMENAYNRDVEGVSNEDERLKQLKAGLEEYFAQGDYGDTDELARCVALYEFITHQAPNAHWLQKVSYSVGSFLEGAVNYEMNANVFSPLSAVSVNQQLVAYQGIESLFSSVAESMSEGKPVYKSYIKDFLDGSLKGWQDLESSRQEDRIYLDPTAASASELGYGLASLATLIASGNAFEGIAKKGVANVASKAASAARIADTSATTVANLDYLTEGMGTMATVLDTTKTAKLANVVANISKAKATSTVAGLVGETFAESITGNPEKFYRVVNSGELTDEAREQLWDDFVGNTVGLAVGVKIGKTFLKIGETTKGRAISHNIARTLAKISTNLGDEWSQAVAKMHGFDDMTQYIKSLSDAEKNEKAVAIELKELIRDVRRTIADSDAIKISGRSEGEILADLNKVEEQMALYRAFENAVDEFNRRGLGYVSEWLTSGRYIKLQNASDAMQNLYESLRKAENSANISRVTKAGKLAISQQTSNYIAALLKRDIVSSAIKALTDADGDKGRIKELGDELEKAQGAIKGYEDLVGGNQNLLQNAKKYSESLKNFYAELNNVLVREGLINANELADLRESGLWGENGELYAHFQRITEDNKLMPLHFSGSFKRDTVEYIKSYVHGSDKDYMDPLVTARLYMRRYADVAARQEVVVQYITATGVGQELLSAADTEAARILSRSLQSATKEEYTHAVRGFVQNIRESDAPRLLANIISGDKQAYKLRNSIKRQDKAILELVENGLDGKKNADGKIVGGVSVSTTKRVLMLLSLPTDDINNVWSKGMTKAYGSDRTVYKYIQENFKNLPKSIRNYIQESVSVTRYASDLNMFGGHTYSEIFDSEGGLKLARQELFAKYGHRYLAESDDATPNLNFLKKMSKSEIKKMTTNLFGKDVSDEFMKQIVDKNGKVQASLIDNAYDRVFYSKPDLKNGVRRFTKRGEKLYNDMNNFQRSAVIGETLDWNKLLNYDNWRNLCKTCPGFEEGLKRAIIAYDKKGEIFDVKKMAKQYVYDEMLSSRAAKLAMNQKNLDFLSEQLGVSKEVLQDGVDQLIDEFVEDINKYPAISKAFDELTEYYGLDEEYAKRYLALRYLVENEGVDLEGSKKTAHEILDTAVANEIRNEHLENATKVSGEKQTAKEQIHAPGYVKGRINKFVWDNIHSAYDDMRTQMHEIAPAFVDEGKMFDEVNKLTKKIDGYKKDVDNIVAIQNSRGEVSFIQTDPLLASMMNHEVVTKPLSRYEKANYLLSKTFRLGTTSLNLKSLVNQTFRDFGNAFIGGNMYRTWSQAKTQMQEVLGEGVVDWIRRSDNDLAEYIMKEAERTGRSAQDIAYDEIRSIGSTIAPTTTETSVYKRAADVSRSIKVENTLKSGRTSDAAMNGVVDAIDKVGDKLGWMNELREGGLRKAVFNNGFADAVKRGYSFDKAKEYATFLMNNATTNFGRTTVMFSRMQRTVPFLGAAINGTTSFYRLLSVDPVGVVGRLIGGIVLPTAYLTAGSLMSPEDRKLWKSIKEYEKDDNIIFISNGQVFSIPIPQELSAWVNPVRHVIETNANANMHSITQLAINDILGLSPIDLDGFMNIDANMMADGTDGEGFFVNNIEPGIAKLFSQLAPVTAKAAMMYATGIDPYTMKKIDRTYSTIDLDTGESVVMGDYSANWVRKVSEFINKNTGFEISAPMAEKMLGSIIGSAPIDYIDWIYGVGDAVINNKDVVSALSAGAEGAVDMLTAPVTVPQYRTKAESDWKEAVTAMYDMREELLMSDEWQAYQTKKKNATTAEELEKLSGVRENLTKSYYDKLKAMVTNLQTKYEADFTAEKYAAVISLSVLDDSGIDGTLYGQYLSDEAYKDAKTRAVDTMYRMGFQSPSDESVFGYLKTNSSGETYVAYSTPMSILQLRNNMNYAKNLHQANMRSIIESKGLQKNGDAYQAMQRQVDAIYNKGSLTSDDYDAISTIYKQWDAQVMTSLYPYLRQYGIDNVLENSDTVEFLNDVIKVPSDFAKTKQGRYFSSPGLNKQAGYAKAYIEYVYNLIEEQ